MSVKDSPSPSGAYQQSPTPQRKSSIFETDEEKPVLSVEGEAKITKTVDLNSDGLCTKFSTDSSKIAVGLSNGATKIYKSDGMSCIYQLNDEETVSARLPVTSLSFVPTGKARRGELLLATYASGLVKFWHVSSNKALHTIHEPSQVLSSSLSPGGEQFITAGSTEQVRIYDVATAKQIHVCEPSPNVLVMDGHRCHIFAVKHHPTMKHIFVTGGWDDTIQFWDDRQERSIRHISGPHICGEAVDIDPKFNHILTASWRKHDSLQVWDFGTGRLIKTIPADYGNESLLYTCQWMGKNHIVCGGSDANMLRIIDKTTLATSGQVLGLPRGVYSLDFDHNTKSLSQHGHYSPDVTTVAAVVGKSLLIVTNNLKP
uniref:cleavage stimulation factor subunit 50-like n=1 Tax=Styela clava TaxID=7725 RepID=UPI001939D397|nr:cleavage stimulation factor subunit 50-like [Styela clava]